MSRVDFRSLGSLGSCASPQFSRRAFSLGAAACLLPACRKAKGDEIVIGHFASLTGNTASFGQDTDRGLRLAIEEENAKGRIAGKSLRVVTLDDRGDSSEAANAVIRLIDLEQVSAVIGEVSSALSLAGGRVAQRRKIPMVSPSSTNLRVTQIGDYIFRVCFLDPFQGKVMAIFARDFLKFDRVALFKDIKNDYSLGLSEVFRKVFTELGGKIVIEQSYALGDTDFSAQLTAIRGTDAQGIFVPGYFTEVGAIARTSARLGLQIPLLGGDGWDSEDLFNIAGDSINGSYFSNHFAPDKASRRAEQFVSHFKAKHGFLPTGLGALGYDAGLVLVDAMRRIQGDAPQPLRDALATTRHFEGTTGAITIDENRNAQKEAVVLRIEKGAGKYVTTLSP